MLKHENVASVGDRIRAYDFNPAMTKEEYYVEGQVIAKGLNVEGNYAAYTIICDRDVRAGVEKVGRKGLQVFVPFESAFLDYDGRVVKV